MQIVAVEISNYRNLDGVKVDFNPEINFLIGENDLGKSNLLDLFEIIFNRRQFSADDYTDASKDIKIGFTLRLSEAEQGIFGDYFDPDDNELINLCAEEKASGLDEGINLSWVESTRNDLIEIPSPLLRNINYIQYDSLKAPKEELTFYRGRGGGRFLSHLIDEFVDPDLSLDTSVMEPLIEDVRSVFNRLQPLKRQGLGLHTDEENPPDFAARALKLTGVDGLDIHKSGYGIQFSTLLVLSILERLARLKRNIRFRPFEENRSFFTKKEYQVFSEMWFSNKALKKLLHPATHTTQEGHIIVALDQLDANARSSLEPNLVDHINRIKHISMVLGLDEPEIHLHPYMQRSLIKYIYRIVNNKDTDFLFVLKKFFDIDNIHGQVLIVSHSPAVLLDQHEQLIRFCRDPKIEVTNGSAITLDQREEKHLLLNFPYIKEAFFSRCAIVVEGDTELGAFPLWANKSIGDLDEHGITILRGSSGGKENIAPVVKLLNHFKIPNVSIIDKDEENDTLPEYTRISGLTTTQYRDFEEELFEAVLQQDRELTVLYNFVADYEARGLKTAIQRTKLSKIAKKYNIPQSWNLSTTQHTFADLQISGNDDLTKTMFIAWMSGNKHIIFGRALGETITVDYIPDVFKLLFEEAKEKVANP